MKGINGCNTGCKQVLDVNILDGQHMLVERLRVARQGRNNQTAAVCHSLSKAETSYLGKVGKKCSHVPVFPSHSCSGTNNF